MVSVRLNLVGNRNQTVPSTIRTIDLPADVLSWYCDWLPHMYDLAGKRLFEDSHWNVPELWEAFNGNSDNVLVLEAVEKLQGYVIIEPDYIGYNNTKCVYIPFLASAPWNRKLPHRDSREFKNIGKILLAFAALLGYQHNNNPEFELHSLPGAENFYRNIQMTETGRVKNHLREFHMNEPEAYDLIRFLMPYLVGEYNEK